jgi:hypothetical protein
VGPRPRLEDLLRTGVAVVVATRDHELRPELSRAWAPSLSQSGTRLTVCVETGQDSAVAANLATGSPLAAMLSRLTTHESVQLKGLPVEVCAPTPERLVSVAEHIDRFVAEGEQVGMPETFARGLIGHELLDVTIEVQQCTDETPGPDTGRRL